MCDFFLLWLKKTWTVSKFDTRVYWCIVLCRFKLCFYQCQVFTLLVGLSAGWHKSHRIDFRGSWMEDGFWAQNRRIFCLGHFSLSFENGNFQHFSGNNAFSLPQESVFYPLVRTISCRSWKIVFLHEPIDIMILSQLLVVLWWAVKDEQSWGDWRVIRGYRDWFWIRFDWMKGDCWAGGVCSTECYCHWHIIILHQSKISINFVSIYKLIWISCNLTKNTTHNSKADKWSIPMRNYRPISLILNKW